MEPELEELQRVYDEIGDTFAAKDMGALERRVAPGWSGEAQGKHVTRDELIANVKSQFESLDGISWPRTISNLRRQGERVTVTAMGVFQATKRESGERVEMQLKNDDTWVRADGEWLIVHSKSLD